MRESTAFHYNNGMLTLSDRWWYARDLRTGREGIVPAAYLY